MIERELERRILARLGADAGDYGIMVKRLADDRGVAINPDNVFYAASLFKLEVLYEVFKQRSLKSLTFEERLPITPRYAEFDLQTLPWEIGCEVPIGLLAEAMITISDNTSALLLYDRAGGWNVDRDMKALGLRHSVITSDDLTTSAHDMALLLEMMARGEAVDKATSEEMVDLLARQKNRTRLPAGLPPGTRVAHKTGEWEDATHDVGIVYAPKGPYIIALLSRRPGVHSVLADLSRLVYDYFEALP